MFESVSIPFGAKMLFNTLKVKAGVNFDDVELALGEICNVVRNTYGGDKGGFICGQVFKFSGFDVLRRQTGTRRHLLRRLGPVSNWRLLGI